MPNITSTKQSLATYYGTLGPYLAICTGNPGNGPAVSNEASGGGYARKAAGWTPGTTGTNATATLDFNVPAGTFTYLAVCGGASGSNLIDKIAVSSLTMPVAGIIRVQLNYTQT